MGIEPCIRFENNEKKQTTESSQEPCVQTKAHSQHRNSLQPLPEVRYTSCKLNKYFQLSNFQTSQDCNEIAYYSGVLVPCNGNGPFCTLTVDCLLGATFHMMIHCAVTGLGARDTARMPKSKLRLGSPFAL